MSDRKRLERLQKKRDALTEKVNRAALKAYGGTQGCCWCGECVQTRGEWKIEQCKDDPLLDEITCGTCGGTGVYLFTILMCFMRPGSPPPIKFKSNAIYANHEPDTGETP